MTKTDRRIAKSKKAIVDAFLELLETRSVDEISVSSITEKANIARKTFYLHYYDKYDLLDTLIDEHLNEMKQRTVISNDKNYSKAEQEWFAYIDTHYKFFENMLSHKGTEYFREQFLQFLIDDTEEEMKDIIPDKKDREIAVQFFSYGVLGILEWWLNSDNPEDAETIAKRTAYLYEMITPQGPK